MDSLTYWSLIIEFIEAFQSIAYKGIPLPLLSRWKRYLSPKLRKAIMVNKVPGIKRMIEKREQIQPYFNHKIKSLPQIEQWNRGTYVVLHDELLRLPMETYLRHFSPNNTIMLTADGSVEMKDYPYLRIPLSKFAQDNREIAKNFIHQAKQLFKNYANHAVFGDQEFQAAFYKDIPLMIDTIEAIHQFLDRYPASCIVLGTTTHLIPRTLALVGKQRGINSICIQHSNIVTESSFFPIFSTKYAIYGAREAEWYLQRGASRQQIEYAGHPRFDCIFSAKGMTQAEFQRKVHLHPQKTKILIATQPYLNIDIFKKIALKLAKVPNLEILIKPHPDEYNGTFPHRYMQLERFVKRYKNVKIITDEVPLYDLLQNVDIVVIWCSTVGLEAMLFGKPVIMINRNLPEDYYQSKVYKILKQQIFHNLNQLVSSIRRIISNKTERKEIVQRQNRFLQMAYPITQSGWRIQQLIEDLSC